MFRLETEREKIVLTTWEMCNLITFERHSHIWDHNFRMELKEQGAFIRPKR